MKKHLAVVTLLLVASTTMACDDKGREFVKMSDRIAGYVETGIDLVEKQGASGAIKPEAQVEILKAFRAVNTINRELLTEAKKYQSADGKRLELTGPGKQKMMQIIGSGQSISRELLFNEQFLTIDDSQKRIATVGIINDIMETFSVMVQLVDTVKTK